MEDSVKFLRQKIRSINDFPKPGIIYRDITTLLQDAEAFERAIDLCSPYISDDIHIIAGIEARGFIIGSALAQKYKKGFVPIRKKNKLPHDVFSEKYNLEYGTDELEIHQDAIQRNQNVLLVDDVLATGGTAEASIKLLAKLGAANLKMLFLIELTDLEGRVRLGNYSKKVDSIIKF